MNTHTIDANVEGLVRLAVRPDLRSKIRQQALLQQELQLDSIDLVCLAIELEDFFRIVISDEAIASWRTLADITDTIAEAAPMPAPRVAQPDYAALGLGSAEEAEGRN
ncbi:acyl carrier protein [Novosphingobium sp.]|jgi:acyl carrier protein|uniref:acyl carrier protein n=1 Tax=Novosphingobium sp. TaxID=1874826 RepID=UPI001EB3EB54|nr:acyl carrier protein [Novosphingobium sp.]MBK6801679.1 acyl carrier protein [Novosphingobium sp.]MBK9009953.1 acyl carrier protein [Novosphingobium sp.]